MKRFYLYLPLLLLLPATVAGADTANVAADTVNAAVSIDTTDIAVMKMIGEEAAEVFMKRYGIASADTLEARIRRDYMLCNGDPARVSRDRLFRWKTYIDSMVIDAGYSEKFNVFVATTGIKAHEVRPCEPIAFHENHERQTRTVDSLFAVQHAARERARNDSIIVINELRRVRPTPADILNISAGMSRQAVQLILAGNNIRTTNAATYLQADNIKFSDITVTIAFYFDNNNRLTGYEIETAALRADRLDDAVREWANQLVNTYKQRLGPPTDVRRVSFRDIKQGRMSITTSWDKTPSRPKVLVGLATHNHLYYAKAMVSY